LNSSTIKNYPTDDVRWKNVYAELSKYAFSKNSLIQVLHTVQDTFGYLDKKSIHYVAKSLDIPFSQVYGVATFYHYFTLKPPALHTCTICTGTACHIKGADFLLKAVKDNFGVIPCEMTPDGKLAIFTARCLGACGIAPVAIIDNEVVGNLEPEILLSKLNGVLKSVN
jgi:bidirectional [NiFe] hydrogenase diaphorase subunit